MTFLSASCYLRCHWLANIPGINGDEAWYGAQAMDLLDGHSLSWRTPPGNPLNPLFFLPVLALHAIFPPSILLLRTVSVASGVAAIAVNWWFCRRVFDLRTAWISSVALAVLPVNIAYSRLAWDASQSLLVTLPVLYASLAAVQSAKRFDQWLAVAIVAQLLAVWVHPTNIFAGAAIGAAVGGRVLLAWRNRNAAAGTGTTRIKLLRIAGVMALAAMVLSLWAANIARAQSTPTGRLEQLGWLIRPEGAMEWSALYARLLSGGTAYQYLAGAHSWLQWPGGSGGGWDLDVLGVWLVLTSSVWLCGARVPPAAVKDQGSPGGRTTSGRVLAATWLLQLAAFLVLAGPMALVPGQERYAICLVAPAVVLASRGLVVAWLRWPRAWPAMLTAASLVGGLLLADFYQHYFRFIEQTGGEGHRTFRTAAVEPKQAALDYIVGQRAPGMNWIVASEWWNYWPLRHLAAETQDVRVIAPEEIESSEDSRTAFSAGRVWYVEFSGSEGLTSARAALAGGPVEEHVLTDYGDRPVLYVLRMRGR